MTGSIYPALKEKATSVARRIGAPSFYRDHGEEIERSASSFAGNGLLAKCLSHLDGATLHPAHGIAHCEKVAVEAGAILRIEGQGRRTGVADTDGLVLCAQIAGILHDIKRNENDHTIKGSMEAEKFLGEFDWEERYKRYVAAAIRNHEAFKKVLPSEDDEAKLVSDSLYDADKFRWGPDNFTTTLWLIVESAETPAERLHDIFLEKMEGIRRIKETFRTDTGKKYGPEFIDFGIEIGNEIFREMENLMRNRK